MKILKAFLLILVVLVVAVAGAGLLLPRSVHVERSTVIAAPRATLFVLVNGFRTFNRWSPWYAMDPAAKYAYSGPETGAGAKMSWVGNPKTVGSGSQEILESVPPTRVKTRLDFGPKGSAVALFSLAPEESKTKVVWGFDTELGRNPFMRYLGLMLDRIIGKDFEAGLAGLKKFAEALPQADFSDLEAEVVEVQPVTVAYVAGKSAKDEKAMGSAIGAAYGEIGRFLRSQGLEQAGPPITVNTKWEGDLYEFDAAIPVNREPALEAPVGSPVKVKRTYGGKAVRATHVGSYQRIPRVYEKLFAFVAAHGYEMAGPPWDEYVSDPGMTSEDRLITRVYVPVR
jgi:effector-binding domain-containing protein